VSNLPLTSSSRWTWFVRGLQLAASILVLGLLARDVDMDGLAAIRDRLSPGWLGLAVGLKLFTLFLHEQRLWLAFNRPRPPLGKVLAIGFAAGALNLVLPGRAGDVAAVALLRRECRVTVGAATAAVGIASFLEFAVFGVLLLGVLALGAGRWELVIGAEAHGRAMQWVTVATLAGIGAAAIATVIGRRLLSKDEAVEPAPRRGLREFLGETLRQASQSFSTPGALLMNTGLAVVQVVGMVGAFALAFPAIGLDIPLPLLAAAGVLAISSVASVVLPPGYGASPAAASVLVLAAFGATQADALAYAAAWWVISQLPATAIGVPILLGRRWRASR
jgi:uncharacterized membrane protein YbhN (UPF0104 family)